MKSVLVDSNVILDVVTQDSQWGQWSSDALEKCADESLLVINPIIYAEVSISFKNIEELEISLPQSIFQREPIPWEAAFLAGKCFLRYRRQKGARTTPLPDFFIGAHAAVNQYRLLTRDSARFRTYFPGVEIIAP